MIFRTKNGSGISILFDWRDWMNLALNVNFFPRDGFISVAFDILGISVDANVYWGDWDIKTDDMF